MHAVLERVVRSNLRVKCATSTPTLHNCTPKGSAYKWNAQQVVEHLVLGYRLTTEALETRLKKGRLSRKHTAYLSAMVTADDDPHLRSYAARSAGAGGDDAETRAAFRP